MNQEAKLDWHERIANEQERGASNSRKEGRKNSDRHGRKKKKKKKQKWIGMKGLLTNRSAVFNDSS